MTESNNILMKFAKMLQVAILTLVLIAIPVQAYAAASVSCDGFTLEDTDIPTVAECEGQISLSTLFTSSICLMRSVMAEAMFEVYCDIMEGMKEPVKAALTLWVIFYAISVMFGLGNASGRDVILKIFKVTIIFALVSNAELFYTFLYEFFIHGLLEGVSSIFFAMDPDNVSSGNPDAESLIDEGAEHEENLVGIFSYVDELFSVVIGGDRLIALGVLMAAYWYTGVGLIVSLLLMLGVVAMIQAFFRILITYAVAILALSFILMFAPLFLTFALFSRTSDLFLGWMSAIVSYIVQPIVVMAFVFLFAAVSDISDFIEELQYDDPASQTGEKVNDDAEHSLDLIAMVFKGEAPAFKDMDGTPSENPNASFLNQGDPTQGDFAKGVFFALSFLILNAVMNAFLKRVPEFAQMLGRFQGQFNTPAIAMTPGMSWNDPRRGTGVFTPDRFLTGSSLWKGGESFIQRQGGAGARAAGEALYGKK